MKIILKAKDIPDKSTITKPTGTNEYTLLRSINIYTNDTATIENVDNITDRKIVTNTSCVFLISPKGNISVCSGEKEFAVICNERWEAEELINKVFGEE